MRAFIENVLTEEEAEKLASSQLHKQDFDHPLIKKVLSRVEKIIGKRSYSFPSYLSIEKKESSHEWHTDTGSNGHMKWCNYGLSTLLTKSSKGLFKYKNPSKEYSQEDHYLNTILHSSDEWHKREKATKGRAVLLMFLS
jgi:hypothetical protein